MTTLTFTFILQPYLRLLTLHNLTFRPIALQLQQMGDSDIQLISLHRVEHKKTHSNTHVNKGRGGMGREREIERERQPGSM